MYSDSATNFKGTDAELLKAINELDHEKNSKKNHSERYDMEIYSSSSFHFGDCWESSRWMIHSVKIILYMLLKGKFPNEEILQIFLRKAEYLISSRPLTFDSVMLMILKVSFQTVFY